MWVNALIVDLDNTLFPAKSIPEEVFDPVIDRVRELNLGKRGVRREILEQAIAACWDHAFDVVAAKYSLPEILQNAWHEEMKSVEVTGPLEPYPDVEALGTLPVPKYLVTTGYRRFQESKIDALAIRPLFEGVYIDALGEGERTGKEEVFAGILARLDEQPEKVGVLGDSADSEIAVGNKLGMRTVQVVRDGVRRAQRADHHIRSLWDLGGIFRWT